MATNVVNPTPDFDINAEIDRILAETAGQPGTEPSAPAAPKLKIDGKEVDPADAQAAIEAALKARDERLARIEQTLTRVEEPVRPAGVPSAPAAPAAPTPPTPRQKKALDEAGARRFFDDPSGFIAEALSEHLGGTDVGAALRAIAELSVTNQRALGETRQQIANQFLQSEVNRFLERADELGYEANPTNAAILNRVREEAGAQPTASGWESAYYTAVARGLIVPRRAEETTAPAAPAATTRRVPSLGGAAPSSEPSFDMSRLDKLPTEELRRLLDKF